MTAFALTADDFGEENCQETSQVGVLGYLVEIAAIFGEVVSRSQRKGPEPDRAETEAFHYTTQSRLERWEQLLKKYLHGGRPGGEPVDGLQILNHYTAMILHRYVRHFDVGSPLVRENVRGTYGHARALLELVQRLSNDQERGGAAFRFATMSPFSGFAITSALDIVTATGTMADLMGHKSQLMSLISSGVEALEGLIDFWHSARQQRDMIKQRLSILLNATNKASDYHGAFYFGQPMQSPLGLDHDLVYGLPRRRYFEALGWDDRLHPGADFHRLDWRAEA